MNLDTALALAGTATMGLLCIVVVWKLHLRSVGLAKGLHQILMASHEENIRKLAENCLKFNGFM